jgi:hypothetical protein
MKLTTSFYLFTANAAHSKGYANLYANLGYRVIETLSLIYWHYLLFDTMAQLQNVDIFLLRFDSQKAEREEKRTKI